MKNLLLLALVLFSFSAMSQTANDVTNEGEVVYITTINLHKQLRGDRAEEMKKRIPEFKKMKSVLYFSETEMLYHKLKDDSDVKEEDLQEGGGRGRGRMRMMSGSVDDRFYTNIDEEIVAEKIDFMGKIFLIEGDMKLRQWKLTGEQKTILGYVCQKAELVIKVDETIKKEEKKEEEGRSRRRGPREPKSVAAWFTTQIPIAGGPRDYHQLPGMVLKVDIDNGNQIIQAESVNLKKLDKKIIEQPTKGKKVTREEYRNIQKEKMAEMRKERGGKGHGGSGRPPHRN